MFRKIMVPVDLRHLDTLEKALTLAADIAGQYGATVIYVAETAATPGPLGHTPEQFGEKLTAFAEDEGRKHGHKAEAKTLVGHDPSIDLDKKLLEETRSDDIDLVVMASHVPNIADYFWPSHGGKLATHADCSVLIVRG